MNKNLNTRNQSILRKDFFNSIDLPYDEGAIIDLEECEILFLYFLEISSDPVFTILKNFKNNFTEVHKHFLKQKLKELKFNEAHFEYIVKDSSFDTLDCLCILSLGFYKDFIRFIIKKKYFYFLENLLEYPQTYKIFEDRNIWFPLSWFLSDESYVNFIYNIIKKLISKNIKIKENFIFSINEIIKKNQERNKMVHKKEEVISDKEAYFFNLLINKFLEIILQKKMEIPKDKTSFTNFIFTSKLEFFRLCYIKLIEERKIKKLEEDDVSEIDEILKNIINEKKFGEFLGDVILNNKNGFFSTSNCNNINNTNDNTNNINNTNDNNNTNTNNDTNTNINSTNTNINNNNNNDNTNTNNTINNTNNNGNNQSSNFYSFDYILVGNIYLYIFELFPPNLLVLTFLFNFDIFKQHILRVLVQNPNIIKFSLLNNIIDYYNKIQKEGHKIEIRYLINLILVENSTTILKTCTRNIKFINFLMSDFEFCLSRGLNGLIEINDILRKLHKANTSLENIESFKSLILEVRIQKNRISTSFVFVDTCFKLLFTVIQKNVDLLLVDELIEIFVKILNCNLKMIVGPKCSKLVLKNPFSNEKSPFSNITKESLNFKPKDLLRNIILLYLNIKSKKFINFVCNEGMYFDLDLFKIGLEICENKYLLNNSQLNELRLLISQFEKLKQEFIEEEVSDQEMYDPLTYNLIKDPIKLLTSNITVDRSTYNMIMLNDGIDPFNRQPLDETKIVEDEQMKDKIKKYENKK